jgi:SH3-like domain-containing protein
VQEIDHRFAGQGVTLETWRRVKDLSPPLAAVLDSLKSGDRVATFAALDALTSRWRALLASMA